MAYRHLAVAMLLIPVFLLAKEPLRKNSLPGDYEYLIVCRNEYKTAFNEFIAFNARRALRSKVVCIEEVKAFTGTDLPEKLRNFIKQEYSQHNLRYVLLAGNELPEDTNGIPHRKLYAKCYDSQVMPERFVEDTIPSDMYFACLDGDWKTAGGSIKKYGDYGTEDIGHEIYIGRFCASTASQLNNMIQKTIQYCEHPVTDNAINNLMLAGEFLWSCSCGPETGTKTMKTLLGTPDSNGYTTCGFDTKTWSVTEISYEQHNDWVPDKKELFYSGIQNNKCAFVAHCGLTNREWAIGYYSDKLSDTLFTLCNGKDANYFFFCSITCDVGAFDPLKTLNKECWAEKITGLSTGPVAMITNTRDFKLKDHGTDGASIRAVRWFFDALFNPNKKFHYAGQMLAKAKEADASGITLSGIPDNDITKDTKYLGTLKFAYYNLNLFGDPALSLWTAKPEKLNLQPQLIGNKLSLDTKGAYSSIALVDENNTIFITRQTGIDGLCTIEDSTLAQYITAHPNGTIKIRVKAHNFLPDSATVSISTGIQFSTGAPDIVPLITVKNNKLMIRFTINKCLPVTVCFFNSRGIRIKTLFNKTLEKGSFEKQLDTGGLSSGIYYCQLTVGALQRTIRFQIVR